VVYPHSPYSPAIRRRQLAGATIFDAHHQNHSEQRLHDMRRQLYLLRSFDLIACQCVPPLTPTDRTEEMEEKEMSTKFAARPIFDFRTMFCFKRICR
jgi:hypothetical protein